MDGIERAVLILAIAVNSIATLACFYTYNRANAKLDKYGNIIEITETKNIAACIILSIVTFGIYNIVWMVSICKKIRALNDQSKKVGGEVVCFYLVPFYSFYWYYTRGKRLAEGAVNKGLNISDNSTMYLLLAIFQLSIVSVALMQNDLNTIATNVDISNIGENTKVPKNTQVNTVKTDMGNANVQKLKELNELKEQGIISEEEFETKKKEILDRI